MSSHLFVSRSGTGWAVPCFFKHASYTPPPKKKRNTLFKCLPYWVWDGSHFETVNRVGVKTRASSEMVGEACCFPLHPKKGPSFHTQATQHGENNAGFFLGVDSPFLSTIVLFKHQLFPQGGGCLFRKKDAWVKNGNGRYPWGLKPRVTCPCWGS